MPESAGEPAPAKVASGGRHPAGLRNLVADIWHLDRGVLAILVTVPLVLTLLEYYGMPWHYSRQQEIRGRLERGMQAPPARNPPFVAELGRIQLPGPRSLQPFLWWVAACLVCMVAIPLLVARFLAGRSPRDIGLKLRGTGREGPTYLLLYLLFAPVLVLISRRSDFQATYPFFRAEDGVGLHFWIFEAAYCLQFFAIETFFRGFITLGLKPRLGPASILVMLAPYCMIHYYKPFPEAVGAIGAGLILGTLAYRSGTVLYGVALHYAVALSMDLLALHHRGAFAG